MGRAKRASKRAQRAAVETPAQRQQRLTLDALGFAGVPDAQRDEQRHPVELCEAPQVGDEPSPRKHTVRKLTRVQVMERSGVLEPWEAAACEWYAERHALCYDTVRVTATYEGRSGGGGDPVAAMVKRHQEQQWAREDLADARKLFLSGHGAIFEAAICRQETVTQLAAASYGLLSPSQGQSKVRRIIKLCACLISSRFSIPWDDRPAARRLAVVSPAVPEPEPAPRPAPSRPITAALDADLDRLWGKGIEVAQIRIASFMLMGLRIEGGDGEEHRGVPLVEEPVWSWGHVPIAASQMPPE